MLQEIMHARKSRLILRQEMTVRNRENEISELNRRIRKVEGVAYTIVSNNTISGIYYTNNRDDVYTFHVRYTLSGAKPNLHAFNLGAEFNDGVLTRVIEQFNLDHGYFN
jgi:hypothetical protein